MAACAKQLQCGLHLAVKEDEYDRARDTNTAIKPALKDWQGQMRQSSQVAAAVPQPLLADAWGQLSKTTIPKSQEMLHEPALSGVGAQGQGAMLTSGSTGHPDLCGRPCRFFAVGQCENGMSCGFCHLDHPHPCVHLDKRQRAELESLPAEDCAALVLSVLRKKVVRITGSPSARAMVESLGQVDSSTIQRRIRPNPQLGAALERMSLRRLLLTLHRCSLASTPEHRQTLDALLKHLLELSRESQQASRTAFPPGTQLCFVAL